MLKSAPILLPWGDLILKNALILVFFKELYHKISSIS